MNALSILNRQIRDDRFLKNTYRHPESMIFALSGHFGCRQLPQLAIDQWQQLFSGGRVALFDGR